MKNKIISFVSWLFGIAAFVVGIPRIFINPAEAIYLLTFGVIIFPPTNQLITKSSQAKSIKIIIGLLFFGSILFQVYLSQLPSPEKEMDATKKSNVNITQQLAKSFCIKNGTCPATLDELFNNKATGPYRDYKVEDYFYKSIDEGKDCLIYTVLSNNEKYSRLCVGENLEYIKYLQNPDAK